MTRSSLLAALPLDVHILVDLALVLLILALLMYALLGPSGSRR